MDEGIFGLDRNQRWILYGIMIAPMVLTPLTILIINDSLVTIVLLQVVCYLGLPYWYMKRVSKEREVSIYFMSEF